MKNIYIKGKNEFCYNMIDGKLYSGFHSGLSNNQCEWQSLIDALEICSGQNYNDVVIYTDAALIYGQVVRKLKTKSPNLISFFRRFNYLKNVMRDSSIVFKLIDKEKNPTRFFYR